MARAVSLGLDNDGLVDNLVKAQYIQTPEIEHVFRIVDRANYFLPEDKVDPHDETQTSYSRDSNCITHYKKVNAYKTTAYKNGNIHISAPGIYSLVMEHLQLRPALSFLNIGSGTGYLSTLAGLLIGAFGVNHGVEIHADLIEYANDKLRMSKITTPALNFLEFCEPVFIKGNGLCLSQDTSKYDRVYCGAACPEEYEDYMKNLIKVDGVLVMPFDNQLLQITRISETQWEQKHIAHVSFSAFQLPTTSDRTNLITLPKTSMQLPPRMPTVSSGNSTGQQKPQSLLAKSSQAESKLFPSSSSEDEEDMTTEVGIEAAAISSTFSIPPRNVPREKCDKVVGEDNDDGKNELLQNLKKIKERLQELTERLQELTECPVCFDTLDSTLIQCKNGHGVCSSCGSKMEKCPSCKQEFVVHQSTLLGKILESLPKLCPYVDKGCSVIVLNQEHKTFCKFRPSTCKNPLCCWSGSVKDLIGHVKTCGKGKVCEMSSNAKEPQCLTIDQTKNMFVYAPIIFQNQLFWKYFHWDVKTKHISFRFYHVAPSKPTHSYYFIVSFKKGKIEHTNSFKAFTGTVDGTRCGIMLSDSELERYRSPNESDKYEYSIELVTEENIA